MDISNRILSDITVFQKYAKYLPELNRRETWEELVTRNKEMHQNKYPQLHDEIESAYKFVYDKKVLPSMRSLQFGGKPIEINPSRIYNCSYLPIDDWRAFGEVMFLLLGGTGVGFSVQKHHVEKLPPIHKPKKDRERRFLVGDSIEGWADAIKAVVKSYFFSGSSLRFDYSDIRPKGTRLITSGGKAPGPEPLRICIEKIRSILELKNDGENLTPLEVHDIICHIADAVLAGGIRRAALISLFSADDNEMISCKFGAWWELNPQRGRANNSAVLLRSKITEEFFKELWKKIELSNAGEPGIYFSNDKDWGTNPCCEIALRPFQMCNLCEVNASDVVDQQDLEDRVRAAAFIGTLQASYTEFHYLRPIWQRTCEKDALLGIGMTGIGSGVVQKLDVKTSAKIAKEENERVANLLGINKAARVTCIKPSGTTSCVLGTSSGIHAWHNDYYIRRIRIGKNEALYNYLIQNHPQLVEDEYFRPHDTAVVGVPQKAPDHAIMRTESPIQLLERVKWFSQQWIRQGHRSGMNTHNISATVSIREHEWPAVGEWLWENRDTYNGISVLPFSDHSYIQSPFEDITEERYHQLMETLKDVDLRLVIEMDDETELAGEIACGALGCEIK
jgi:ribonucleoside-diphosphate reductase alpha chain